VLDRPEIPLHTNDSEKYLDSVRIRDGLAIRRGMDSEYQDEAA
jgi:hypothetical protein